MHPAGDHAKRAQSLVAMIVTVTGLISAVPTLSSAALAVGFAITIGLFFGIAPAQRRAARPDRRDPL